MVMVLPPENVSAFDQLGRCTHQAARIYAVVVGEIVVFST